MLISLNSASLVYCPPAKFPNLESCKHRKRKSLRLLLGLNLLETILSLRSISCIMQSASVHSRSSLSPNYERPHRHIQSWAAVNGPNACSVYLWASWLAYHKFFHIQSGPKKLGLVVKFNFGHHFFPHG